MDSSRVESSVKTQVSCRFLDYITVQMLTVLSVIALIVFLLRDTFSASFMANVWLNGTIIGLIAYAVFTAFKNNFDLLRTAYYIRHIEAVEENPKFKPEHVQKLIKGLRGPGRMFDMQNSYQVLKKMTDTGFFCASDLDARLIKSKLGGRMRSKRNMVAFYASVLVTLGLIGTFWGLILTITAVGQVLVEVSANIGEGSEMGISALISGISKPLSGMGVAFSSSLFGLAGSLALVLLNFLGGMAQDRFMEQTARWLDEHIPSMNPNLIKKSKDAVSKPIAPAPKQDMEALLGSYVVLSQDTHVRLRALTSEIGDFKSTFGNHESLLRKGIEQQTLLNTTIAKIGEQGHLTLEQLSRLNVAQGKITEALHKQIEAFNKGQLKLGEVVGTSSNIMKTALEKNAHTVERALDKKVSGMSGQFGSHIQTIANKLKGQEQQFEKWAKTAQGIEGAQQQGMKYQQKTIAHLEKILSENGKLQGALVKYMAVSKDAPKVEAILKRLEDLSQEIQKQ